MVVYKHPFDPVVKELGVVALLTCKQKKRTKWVCVFLRRGTVCAKDDVSTHCTGCKLYSDLHVWCRGTSPLPAEEEQTCFNGSEWMQVGKLADIRKELEEEVHAETNLDGIPVEGLLPRRGEGHGDDTICRSKTLCSTTRVKARIFGAVRWDGTCDVREVKVKPVLLVAPLILRHLRKVNDSAEALSHCKVRRRRSCLPSSW